MSRVNVRELNPARYDQVKAEQDTLLQEYETQMKIARICPYCQHKVEMLVRGYHGATMIKCPHCGENIVFPPISFRIA